MSKAIRIPARHYLVHDSDLAMLEGHIIGIFSSSPPLITPDDMDELNRRFDHIRRRHQDLMGVDQDAPEDRP